STFTVSAQSGGKPISGGNPTPGTEQPDPPNLSDRIAVTGCLQPAPTSTASSETSDPNTPSNARFVLSSAKRVDRLPPGTGGSQLAVKANSASYRLEGIDSQFSPFVNARVEVSGEVKPPSDKSNEPTLLVEFIQKTAATCRP
ncbi:MAG TPA: hypothetical protein VMS40_19480, partial [Vicinamibacterales bacterium]|nr:hypothetical protein [Vicinamibacterales bacterium]